MPLILYKVWRKSVKYYSYSYNIKPTNITTNIVKLDNIYVTYNRF